VWEILVSEEDPSSPILAVYRVDEIVLIKIYAWGEADVLIGDGYGNGVVTARVLDVGDGWTTSRKDIVKNFFEKIEVVILRSIQFANNFGNKIDPYVPSLSECVMLDPGSCYIEINSIRQ
jgi:hypothetical protein